MFGMQRPTGRERTIKRPAPHQAARVRPLGGGEWTDVSGAKIDPTRAYVQRLPSGRTTNKNRKRASIAPEKGRGKHYRLVLRLPETNRAINLAFAA